MPQQLRNILDIGAIAVAVVDNLQCFRVDNVAVVAPDELVEHKPGVVLDYVTEVGLLADAEQSGVEMVVFLVDRLGDKELSGERHVAPDVVPELLGQHIEQLPERGVARR